MSEDIVFKAEDIDKYLAPRGLKESLYQLYGIIQLSKKLDERRTEHEIK